MTDLEKADLIILKNFNTKYPQIRYILSDLISERRICEMYKDYDCKEQTIRNIANRYSKYLKEFKEND